MSLCGRLRARRGRTIRQLAVTRPRGALVCKPSTHEARIHPKSTTALVAKRHAGSMVPRAELEGTRLLRFPKYIVVLLLCLLVTRALGALAPRHLRPEPRERRLDALVT
eukprot:scaffold178499_cov30-Tisochrysis_lutea.AAC.6